MAGEYTTKVEDYMNIIKSNGIITDDGEIVENVSKRSLELIAMDFINMEEQKKEQVEEVMQWQKEKTEFQEAIIDNCGHFYFNFYQRLLNKLQPQYLTRFLYLSCFINYDNRLVINKTTRHIPIYEEDLQSILKLSRAETYNTKNILIEKGLLIIHEDKTMSINDTYCKKGEIMKNKKVEKVRMFENGMKELYEKSKPSEHKQMALLFEMLPMINLRWNVVCENPTEEVKECIKPYSLKDLARQLNQTNVTRFKQKLMDMTIGNEPVVCINEIKHKKFLTINPKIYYKGVNLEELKAIIALFDMSENVDKDQ